MTHLSLPVVKHYNFARADYAAMNAFFANLDWHILLHNCPDVNAVCQVISSIVSNAIDQFVPTPKGPRFNVPLHIRQLRNEHVRLHRMLRKGNEAVRFEFQQVRNRYKIAVRNWQCHREYHVLTSWVLMAIFQNRF